MAGMKNKTKLSSRTKFFITLIVKNKNSTNFSVINYTQHKYVYNKNHKERKNGSRKYKQKKSQQPNQTGEYKSPLTIQIHERR